MRRYEAAMPARELMRREVDAAHMLLYTRSVDGMRVVKVMRVCHYAYAAADFSLPPMPRYYASATRHARARELPLTRYSVTHAIVD